MFSNNRMANKIIPHFLITNARIEYVAQGSRQLHDKVDVFALCWWLQRIVGLRVEGKHKKIQDSSSRQTGNGNQRVSQSNDKADPAICCIHGDHTWAKCPKSKSNKGKAGASTKSKASKKDEAASMEAQGSNRNKTPTIHFDSKDKDLVVSCSKQHFESSAPLNPNNFP